MLTVAAMVLDESPARVVAALDRVEPIAAEPLDAPSASHPTDPLPAALEPLHLEPPPRP